MVSAPAKVLLALSIILCDQDPARWSRCCCLQALFRKIAAALPGMQSLSANKPDDMVDVNLSASAQNSKAGGSSATASSCNC